MPWCTKGQIAKFVQNFVLVIPLAIFLRFQAFQRHMINDVVFWWKVDSIAGHFAATL